MAESSTGAVYFGALSLFVAALSVGLFAVLREWPAELGGGGAVLFALVGILLVGYYALNYPC